MEQNRIPAGTIVVGIDGSDSSERALRWAVEEALLESRDLALVHAVALDAMFRSQPGLEQAHVVELVWDGARELLATSVELATRLLADEGSHERRRRTPQVHAALRSGDPRSVLVELSREATCLVLGSRGRGSVRSLLLGSVGLAVTDRAECPVVVIRPHREGLVRRGVLVGVDGTEASLPALEYAYRQASQRDLPLTVVHCYYNLAFPDTGPVVEYADDSLEQRRLLLAESVAGMGEKYPDVHVAVELVRGLPEDRLVERSRQMHLVVVGTAPMSWIDGLLLGDVSRRVVERAQSVVAVVPSAPR